MRSEDRNSARSDYQLTFDHVERLLDRRQSTTSFYISLNAGIAAASNCY
jgi:hypothetical protein